MWSTPRKTQRSRGALRPEIAGRAARAAGRAWHRQCRCGSLRSGSSWTTHSADKRMSNAIHRDRLSLASHVRACDCASSVVLLDLRHGRYLGVSNAVSKSLCGQVEGWPAPSGPAEAAAPQDTHRAALRSLVVQGLLTEEQVAPRPMNALVTAATSIDESPPAASRFPGVRRSLQFTTSVAQAAWCLRFRSLQTIASSITVHRERLVTPGSDSIEAMRPAVLAYETLRPFVFTAREKCLLDSLALITFLAKDGLLPCWVIGVRTRPFGAHSWVQCGSTVLNDQHEYVRQFRPILVV